ncbi:ComF family protein [Desulfamplus magnetovallimortis]|uniref:ComF family protein n=1 Tax=Desulfamplus magnetovallimortis TaxID=1246637 RepID=UPI001117D9BB|nr:ComF family protein [Desulfamplus magnetovallimortis]
MAFQDIIGNIGAEFLDCLFPPKCLKCGFIMSGNKAFSKHFQAKIPFSFESDLTQWQYFVDSIKSCFCDRCLEYLGCCHLCPDTDFSLSSFKAPEKSGIRYAWAASRYQGIIKESIHLLKYDDKTVLANRLGKLLFFIFVRKYSGYDIDLIVPIPLYRWRMVKRGFNQSFLLVKDFQRWWFQQKGIEPNWSVNYRCLARRKNTKSQVGFTREERKLNMSNAFTVKRPDDVRKKKVLLVDDVHTTGATSSEAAVRLYDAGADCVDLLVLANA